MRWLFIVFFVFNTLFSNAQSQVEPQFIGAAILYSNTINAHGILPTDSICYLVESEVQNLYGFKYLNTYKISVGKMWLKTGLKFSYKYIQENIFTKHDLNIGIQKKLSDKLNSNIMLGTNLINDKVRVREHFVYGISLRYKFSSCLFIHKQFKTLNVENGNPITESNCGLYYKVSKTCAAVAQLDYYQYFDGILGVVLTISGIQVQATHTFVRNKLAFGIGFNCLNINFNFVYSYQEILGGESYARIQIEL